MTKKDRRWFVDRVMTPSLPIPQWLIDQAAAVYKFEQLCREMGLDAEYLLPLIRKEVEETLPPFLAVMDKWIRQIHERPPYTVIISENYRRAEFALQDREFPINPRARTTIILTDPLPGIQKIRGHRFDEALGDRLIWESGPAGRYDEGTELLRELHARGFPPKEP